MDPQHFPEETGTYAKGQPQFRTLPVRQTKLDKGPDLGFVINEYTSKWGLSDFEVELIRITRAVFSTQTGTALQPQSLRIENPWRNFLIKYKDLGDGFYDAYVPLTNGLTYTIEHETPKEIIEHITNYFPDIEAQHLVFEEVPGMAIDEDGSIKEI